MTRLSSISVAALVALLYAGIVCIAGLSTPNVFAHAAVSAAAAAVMLLAIRRLAPLRPVRGAASIGLVGAAVLIVAAGGALSMPKEVDDEIPDFDVPAAARATDVDAAGETAGADDQDAAAASDAAAPAPAPSGNVLVGSGDFGSLAHATEGEALAIETADGVQLALRDFATDPGPDLRVILVAGDPQSDGEVTDYVDLGPLKGNSGNQVYEVPSGTDLDRYDTVYIWCRAFTVGFGSATLAAS